MPKGLRFGVQNISRNGKKGYIGVNDVPKKIKKVYVGDPNGLARLGWSSGSKQVSYYGLADNLQVARHDSGMASTADYALFAGGDAGSSNVYDKVDAYNASLTHTASLSLSRVRTDVGFASVGDYAVFVNGHKGSFVYDDVDCFSNSLTRTALSLTFNSWWPAGVGSSSFAIFGGGAYYDSGNVRQRNQVNGMNASLTVTSLTSLSYSRNPSWGARTGNYLLIAGGRNITSSATTYVSTIDVYDTSGSKVSTSITLTNNVKFAPGTTLNDCAMFGGGSNGTKLFDTVDVFNSSLTRSNPSPLSVARSTFPACSVDGCAVFAGGTINNNVYQDTLDIYDSSFTHTVSSLPTVLYNSSAAAVGNKILVAGGRQNTSSYSDAVYVYEVTDVA